MTQFRKKPVVITAINFAQLVAHGIASGGNVVNGMPWSFTYAGHAITHENDDCYLIPTLEGTMKMGRDDMLITGVKGEIYPCKRDIFEATYDPAPTALPVVDPGPDSLEREIQAKADKGPRVMPAALQAEIVSEHYFTAKQGCIGALGDAYELLGKTLDNPLGLLTFCVLILRNGFTVHGVSACASPENYNKEIGERIARENAEREIWPLLGFRLRDELARPVLTDADAAADLAGTPRPDHPTAEAADFLASVKACNLAGEGPCEACQ
ncbi:Gp49 family protein [Acidovorax sp. NB1]|uniref:Gp49 family protein n=1 Tax=Acidovorax sp. NB1 TaxID=1943571 RepID=UPI0010E38E23|nr:Gp49 family protein [Acidovorax sp. NB1]GDY37206.1 hypothetical protein ACINB_30980 [Acidovorax sp. NB1]